MFSYTESIIPDWSQIHPESNEYHKHKANGLNYARLELSLRVLKSETIIYAQTINIKNNNFSKLDESVFQTIGKYCWMLNNGAVFKSDTTDFINQKFEELQTKIKQIPTEKPKQKITPTNIAFILYSDFEDLILEETLDNGILVYEQLNKFNPSPKSINILIKQLNEVLLFLSSLSNEERTEAYSNKYDKIVNQFKLILKIIKSYKKNGKILRKNQRNKSKRFNSNYRITKKVEEIKYKKQDLDLHLTSIDPKTIIGSNILLMYNTKNRKLSLLYSLDKGFEIRGTTIHNIDNEKSFQKTLRKPQQQLESLNNATQRRVELVLGEYIKGKAANVIGRTNNDTIFINVW